MDTNSIPNFEGQTITGERVVGIVEAIGHTGLKLLQTDNGWMWTAPGAVKGFDLQRRYTNAHEAALFLVGNFLNNDAFKTIGQGLAA